MKSSLHWFFLSLCLLFISNAFLLAQDLVPTPIGGVPGQISEETSGKKIYFENGISVDWNGMMLSLKDANAKEIILVNLSSGVEKKSARQNLGDQVVEEDLGGTKKKKAPLAYKNPVFRDIKVPRGTEDPLKASGVQVSHVDEKNMPEGGKETTTDYADGSKSIKFVSSELLEESAFNKKGEIVWLNIEGQDKGFKFKKTQWQDGSLIREYSTNDGILSVTYDQSGGNLSFSFLKPDRESLKEVNCQNGICEAN